MFESFHNPPAAQGQKKSEPRLGLRREAQRHAAFARTMV
jgi:hypothetical protein